MPQHIPSPPDFLDKVPFDDNSSEAIDEENVSFLSGHHHQKLSTISGIRQNTSRILATALALNFLILSYILWNPQQWKHGSYELGFKTDYGMFEMKPIP